MFDLSYFKANPHVFYSFAKQIFPFSSTTSSRSKEQVTTDKITIEPSDSHWFLKLIESKSKLLRNYTQNIDTLEMRAGVEHVIQCHGSFATFSCLKCSTRYPGHIFESQISQGAIVLCPSCTTAITSKQTHHLKPGVKKKHKKQRRNGRDHDQAGWASDDDDSDENEEFDWVSNGLVKPDIIFFWGRFTRSFS